MALVAEWMIALEENAPPERLVGILERLVQADPDEEMYPLLHGRLLLEMGKTGEALKVLEQARSRFPGSWAFLELLSLAYQQRNQTAEAIRLLKEGIRLAPKEGRLYITLSAALLGSGKTNEAFEVLEQGFQQNARDPLLLGWLENMGMGFAQGGNTDLVIRACRLIISCEPENPRAREMLAVALTSAGRHEDALAEWKWLETYEPDVPVWSHRIGQSLEELGRWEEAADAFGRAMRKPGAMLGSWLRHALSHARSGRKEAAERTLDEAAERFPDSPVPFIVAGMLHSADKNWEAAIGAFERAEARSTAVGEESDSPEGSAEFYYWYGVACDRAGQLDRSEAQFRRAIQKKPDYHEALNHLAYQWAERGTNLAEAMELSLRSLELQPEEPAYWDTLGWIYYKMGDPTNALHWVGRAAAQIHDPEVADHMGDILWVLGREDEALEWWRRSLTLDPTNPSVRYKLETKDHSRPSSAISPAP